MKDGGIGSEEEGRDLVVSVQCLQYFLYSVFPNVESREGGLGPSGMFGVMKFSCVKTVELCCVWVLCVLV